MFFGFGQAGVAQVNQDAQDTSQIVDSHRPQPTTPTLRKSASDADEDSPKDRIRKIERRAAATQQRSLDKKIQALNGSRTLSLFKDFSASNRKSTSNLLMQMKWQR